MVQIVKNSPTIQETWVQSLGQEDPLEKGMMAHSSVLAYRIPWAEKPGRLQSKESQRIRHDWVANTFLFMRLDRDKNYVFIFINLYLWDFLSL